MQSPISAKPGTPHAAQRGQARRRPTARGERLTVDSITPNTCGGDGVR